MNKEVQVKVNVINQLKLFKYSTFKDKLCFIDENIQNAQRAGAKNVYIEANEYDKELIIKNDGDILNEPQKLFSIAESGWNKEVKDTENPFGIGFFSNISVSNLIEIYTGNIHIIFNVDKIISENDTKLEVLDSDNYYNGFKLILKNFNFENIYDFQIEERVKNIGQYAQDIDVYYNDDKIKKKDLLESDGDIFETSIDEEGFKGWISLKNFVISGINIYHRGRFVDKIHGINYVKGDIHINDSVLNLTAPDRKNIIKDDKYYDFRNKIRYYIETLCEDALLNGNDEDIDKFIDGIDCYINKKNIKNKLKFLTFKNEKDMKYLKNIAYCQKEDKNIKNFKDYSLYLEQKSNTQLESNLKNINIEPKMENQVPEAKGIQEIESRCSFTDGYTSKPEIKKDRKEEKQGELIFNSSDPIFWMKFDELNKYEYKFNMINHYNLKLIISRNQIENDILKDLQDDKIYHISKLKENIELKGELSNTGLNIKEQRALMIFDLISRTLDFNHNIFSIGDLMVTKTIEIESIGLKEELIDTNVVALKDIINQKIYIDRSIIDTSDLKESLDTELTITDYKFILNNLYTMAKQVELLKGTTSQKIVKEIILKLGKGELL